MERNYSVTGFCPKVNKDIKVSVTYIFNTDVWEKGISESPCSSPCKDECPILASAPDELKSI
ncbi:hypothetical protein DW074_08730 [Ruminococcus sp. AF46-10NS]|nr:hypothetical protein [Ruminococcus sp. AF46-10NS]RHK23826.1 hypothetical protein DW074_08730 [Ruminococcus sp. AF46-10NS]